MTDITVEGHNFFNLNTKAKFDSDVIITFHKLKKTNLPFSYKEIKGRSGKEAAEAFKNAGFVNVEENVIKDLTFGWLKKDGQIDLITVGDNSRYKADEANRIDVRIVVTYHTFKRDRKK